jgi:hypothetical protein
MAVVPNGLQDASVAGYDPELGRAVDSPSSKVNFSYK